MMSLPNAVKLGTEITSRLKAAQERQEAKVRAEV
jgi:hypothetical protein